MRKRKQLKPRCFDVLVDFPPWNRTQGYNIFLVVKMKKVQAFLEFYEKAEKEVKDEFLARVCPNRALSLKWKDEFEVEKGGGLVGKGIVLNPFSSKVRGSKLKKRINFLRLLRGEEREMLIALIEDKDVKGLGERELLNFSSLSIRSLSHLCQELEEEGKIRILSFRPLFLFSQQSLNFFAGKIVSYLEQYHKKHPGERGVTQEKIRRRFGLNKRILALSLKFIEKQGLIDELGNLVSLSTHKATPTPDDEKILGELEEMCLKGEFRSVSLEDIQQRFRLSSRGLDKLLSFLIERKKIVQGKEGFFLHSRWLKEIVSRLKKSGKKELTVADFKEITGLSRKYSIPLLELLDQMGVTRRKTPSKREIL
jgi:selenocysteine-specific elongation factor